MHFLHVFAVVLFFFFGGFFALLSFFHLLPNTDGAVSKGAVLGIAASCSLSVAIWLLPV